MQASPILGEFLGTFILIFLGESVVANILLKGTKGQNAGLILITTAWGLAVMTGIFVAQKFGSEDAHLNPALTLAFAWKNGEWSHVPSYILAQFAGAFLGAVSTYLFYYPHWEVTEDKGNKLSVFATSPAIKHGPSNFYAEMSGTFVLMVGAGSIYSTDGSGLKPFLVGMLVFVIGNALGGTTGYAINPARDIAPRLAHFLLPIKGKGGSEWSYAWVPLFGPIVGAFLGILLF
ncbi:MIP/aquaporin family protein [Leadbetterella byssophila]|jgi:glycerol uptake facilitator protein|uniref:Major intrinsic protein n=1 Tax=Leadbetterella byssophila (strain DSM 17132 / JCM 16389 / KACC 11308 / NBRC 106382 / 4M15) TaxID=649349 RepID=E4RT86_LEAB4|nr:MIP/aquaporin family protein [Leadbetterella byssophila]ADQ18624.1 major intrinsic protein [Leadbetterella byssophila DSM 17132]